MYKHVQVEGKNNLQIVAFLLLFCRFFLRLIWVLVVDLPLVCLLDLRITIIIYSTTVLTLNTTNLLSYYTTNRFRSMAMLESPLPPTHYTHYIPHPPTRAPILNLGCRKLLILNYAVILRPHHHGRVVWLRELRCHRSDFVVSEQDRHDRLDL